MTIKVISTVIEYLDLKPSLIDFDFDLAVGRTCCMFAHPNYTVFKKNCATLIFAIYLCTSPHIKIPSKKNLDRSVSP